MFFVPEAIYSHSKEHRRLIEVFINVRHRHGWPNPCEAGHAGPRKAAIDLTETIRPAIGSVVYANLYGETASVLARLRQLARSSLFSLECDLATVLQDWRRGADTPL